MLLIRYTHLLDANAMRQEEDEHEHDEDNERDGHQVHRVQVVDVTWARN